MSTIKPPLANWTDTSPAELMAAHLQRPHNTARCYAADMETLAEFLEVTSAVAAVEFLVNLSRGAAERTVHNYLNWLRTRHEALNTVRRKAQSLMGILKLAHRFRVIPWMLDPLKLPAPDPIRDTRGPKRQAVLDMLEICDGRDDAKGARDAAMLRLMAFSALRCNEVLTLDRKHVDLETRSIEILSKGRWDRTLHPITLQTAEAIRRWLRFRGDDDGPMFTTLQRGHKDDASRLTYWGAYHIVVHTGAKAGVHCSPHKLRHFAATEHLRLTNGDVPWAMALTRHRDPKTLMLYNDSRMTKAREAAEMVEAGIPHYGVRSHTPEN